MNSRVGRFRSPRLVVLLLAVLATVLAVAATLLWLSNREAETVHLQGAPMSDAQAAGQVLASAREIVNGARLQDATAGSAFVSCTNANEPPYQAAIYMSFRVPQNDSIKYLRDVAASLAARGWAPAPTTGEHFGQKLTKNGVTAIFYHDGTDTAFATLRLYGQCRNTADHRNDNPAWTEVTDQLG
jgi:hypothetical protein